MAKKKSNALQVTSLKKKTINKEEVFVEKKIELNGLDSMSYLVFCYKELYNLFGLDTDEVNIIIYLKELWIFGLKIKVIDDYISLSSLLNKGFIKENYTLNNKKLYSLSEKGFYVIDRFNYFANNYNQYILENRKTDLGLKAKMSSIIARGYKN